MRLEIELRCTLFPLIILEMFLGVHLWKIQLIGHDFGQAHTCLYKIPDSACHSKNQAMELKELSLDL
jgi:hypothetical protein